MTKFKTVKRKAEVGERILITNAVPVMEQAYENGAIFTVRATNTCGPNDVYVHGLKTLIDGMEYEVIIENETEADGMNELKDKLAEVAEIAQKLSVTFNDIASMLTTAELLKESAPKSEVCGTIRKVTRRDELSRDSVIEKAKRDVAEMLTSYYAEFIVNKEKRTIVALHRYPSGPKAIEGRGIAKCAPDDCFNVHIGKAIALRRALGLEVPAEYLNAPQPTEVRVGDVVWLKNIHEAMDVDSDRIIRISDQINRGLISIIDDSRDGEASE